MERDFGKRFIPRLKSKEADFLEKAEEEERKEELQAKETRSKLADEKFPNQAADHSGNAKADQCSVKGAVHNQCRFHTLKGLWGGWNQWFSIHAR